MECPHIDRECKPNEFHRPVTHSGYEFYRHDDGRGNVVTVQFCKFIGRKEGSCECMREWKKCVVYLGEGGAE